MRRKQFMAMTRCHQRIKIKHFLSDEVEKSVKSERNSHLSHVGVRRDMWTYKNPPPRADESNRRSLTCAFTTMRIPRIAIVHGNVFSVALNHFYDSTMRAELEMPNPPVPSTVYIYVYGAYVPPLYVYMYMPYKHTYIGWSA